MHDWMGQGNKRLAPPLAKRLYGVPASRGSYEGNSYGETSSGKRDHRKVAKV